MNKGSVSFWPLQKEQKVDLESHLLDGSEVKWSASEKREELVLLVSPSVRVSRHPQPLILRSQFGSPT